MSSGQLLLDLAVLVVFAIAGFCLMKLAREVARLHVRLGPLGARMMDFGVAVGGVAPAFEEILDVTGRPLRIGGAGARDQLLLFMSPTCSTCRSLLTGVRSLANRERDIEVIIISDGAPEEHAAFLAGFDLGERLRYASAFEVGFAYEVGATPYGVTVDRQGRVASKGLCNHLQQVESLLNALESGVPSLQHLHRLGTSAQLRGTA